MENLSLPALHHLLKDALTASGFSDANAEALAKQTALAEAMGQTSVGISHMFDYTDGVADGRLDPQAEPIISQPAPCIIASNGQGGLAQTGFDAAFDRLVEQAQSLGLALFSQKNTTLCGALGTYCYRLAERGLVAMAATNGSPLMAGSGTKAPVFCTNPTAFAAPRADQAPILIDQSSSATAFVNIRKASETGETLAEGLALDAKGQPTTDAKSALAGMLLPFGGGRGSNIALMVEVLAAGLSGANWSHEAPSMFQGNQCPNTGLFVLAIRPDLVDADFEAKMSEQLRILSQDKGLYLPGDSKSQALARARNEGIRVDEITLRRLQNMAAGRR